MCECERGGFEEGSIPESKILEGISALVIEIVGGVFCDYLAREQFVFG